jgi:hypothetical protein
LCVLMTILVVAMLQHANAVATKGYEIRQLTQEHTALSTKNRELQQQVSELRALATIKESPLFAELQPITDSSVSYVHHQDGSLVMR